MSSTYLEGLMGKNPKLTKPFDHPLTINSQGILHWSYQLIAC